MDLEVGTWNCETRGLTRERIARYFLDSYIKNYVGTIQSRIWWVLFIFFDLRACCYWQHVVTAIKTELVKSMPLPNFQSMFFSCFWKLQFACRARPIWASCSVHWWCLFTERSGRCKGWCRNLLGWRPLLVGVWFKRLRLIHCDCAITGECNSYFAMSIRCVRIRRWVFARLNNLDVLVLLWGHYRDDMIICWCWFWPGTRADHAADGRPATALKSRLLQTPFNTQSAAARASSSFARTAASPKSVSDIGASVRQSS